MKITDEIREQAALICAISASTGYVLVGDEDQLSRGVSWYGHHLFAADIATWMEFSSPAVGLALDAINAASRRLQQTAGLPRSRELDAEAEAMLRTGWSP